MPAEAAGRGGRVRSPGLGVVFPCPIGHGKAGQDLSSVRFGCNYHNLIEPGFHRISVAKGEMVSHSSRTQQTGGPAATGTASPRSTRLP